MGRAQPHPIQGHRLPSRQNLTEERPVAGRAVEVAFQEQRRAGQVVDGNERLMATRTDHAQESLQSLSGEASQDAWPSMLGPNTVPG